MLEQQVAKRGPHDQRLNDTKWSDWCWTMLNHNDPIQCDRARKRNRFFSQLSLRVSAQRSAFLQIFSDVHMGMKHISPGGGATLRKPVGPIQAVPWLRNGRISRVSLWCRTRSCRMRWKSPTWSSCLMLRWDGLEMISTCSMVTVNYNRDQSWIREREDFNNQYTEEYHNLFRESLPTNQYQGSTQDFEDCSNGFFSLDWRSHTYLETFDIRW